MLKGYSFFKSKNIGTKDDNGGEPDSTEDPFWMLPEQVYTNLDDGVFYGESDGCYYYDSDGDGLPDTMLFDPAIINSDGPNPNPNPDPDPDDPDDEEDDDDDNDYGDEPPTGGGLTDEELMNLGRQAIGKMQTAISNGTFTYIFP